MASENRLRWIGGKVYFHLPHIIEREYIGEFFQGGFLGMKVVTFFATLRADLEDFFKCRR